MHFDMDVCKKKDDDDDDNDNDNDNDNVTDERIMNKRQVRPSIHNSISIV
jgi:hypothetical protein